ncbi:MAG: chromate transporter, partial [Alistipes sp.]|nr:chromate transporter [Alistipes sp.]
TFGGGYAAIPLIRDVVLDYGWLTEDQLTYMIGVSESTPGPIMVNLGRSRDEPHRTDRLALRGCPARQGL